MPSPLCPLHFFSTDCTSSVYRPSNQPAQLESNEAPLPSKACTCPQLKIIERSNKTVHKIKRETGRISVTFHLWVASYVTSLTFIYWYCSISSLVPRCEQDLSRIPYQLPQCLIVRRGEYNNPKGLYLRACNL